MSIPYQPTFKLQPKTGFRYSSQPFVPPVQPINAPPPLGLDGSAAAAPPVMGAGQGPAYANDPFGGGDNFQPNQDQARINQAQSYGYTRGTQNPIGLLQGVPVLGTAMSAMGAFDNLPNETYGQPGTYDAQGNVFGDKGRAYDPITGKAAQSYSKPSDWYGGYLGIGTEGGFLGPDSSYGKLRAAGENPISSALGSYDNSVYKQMDMDPSLTLQGARQSRRMGANSPIQNFANTITQNTLNARDDEFGNLPTGPVWGTRPGDYVQSDQGPLEVSDGGQLKGPDGTVVSLGGVSFINADVTKPETLNRDQRVALAERTNPVANTTAGWHSGNQRATAGTCFPEGTQITMADNTTKNIEDIQVGDKVLAFGEDSKIVEDEVTKVHSHTLTDCCSDSLVKVTLSNDKEFVVTSNHPFYMPEHNGFKWIGLFEKGELVMTKDGMMYPVSSIETLDKNTQAVYNFEVKDTHTYIAEDLRVHNGSGEDDSAGNENVDRSNPNAMASRERSFAESKGYGSTGRPDDTGKSMDQFARDASAGMFSSEQRAEADALSQQMGSGRTDAEIGAGAGDYVSSDPSPFSKGGADTPVTDLTVGDMLGEGVNTTMQGPLSVTNFSNTVK